ncbi:MAG: hypothetical protein FRX48_03380 [Lasallia pustulata]|uniref:Uncharacterized protein n=1 Tax=Lasallia pustulata TaxID=136370 RepID=A0A5M8PS59_9LECA|nr:MAG: hypothetical protein FRX48_03380 [Lasallia pustulata]
MILGNLITESSTSAGQPPCSVSGYYVATARYGEMRSAIARKNKGPGGGITHKLDVMVGHTQLWPTWISLPTSPQHMRNVEVDFRISSYSDREFCWDRRHVPGSLAFKLLRLFSGFFQHGPLFIPHSKLPPFVLHAEAL